MQTKLEVGVIGQGGRPSQRPPTRLIRSLGHFVAVVNQRGLEPELREEVLKIAKGYPEGSLDFLYNTLDSVITKCQNTLTMRNAVDIPDVVYEEPVRPAQTIKPIPPVKAQIEQRKSLFDEEPIAPPAPQKRWDEIIVDNSTPPPVQEAEIKRKELEKQKSQQQASKWSTAPAAEVKKADQPQARRPVQRRKNEAPKKIGPGDIKWIPSNNPELEEYRQKLKYLRENREEIKKQLEEGRKALGEEPPKPQETNYGI